jgi:hypothetical protein
MVRGCGGEAITSPKQNLQVSPHRGFESDFEIKRIENTSQRLVLNVFRSDRDFSQIESLEWRPSLNDFATKEEYTLYRFNSEVFRL